MAHKFLNRFAGWATREGSVRVETARAMEEFFVAPERIPQDRRSVAEGLFLDWFYFDRKLTAYNLTPLELFISRNEKKMKSKEREPYQRVREENRFGFFRVMDVKIGESLEVQAIPNEEIYNVWEESASQTARPGDLLAARLVPFQDHWALAGFFVMPFTGESREIVQKALEGLGKGLDPRGFRPRDMVALIIPRIRWEEMGLERVKAKLASLLDRWRVTDITVSGVEKAFREAHSTDAPFPAIMQEVINRAPNSDDMRLAGELVKAFWNLLISEERPYIDERMLQKGPRERMLLDDLGRWVMEALSEKDLKDPVKVEEAGRRMFRDWVNKPQDSLASKTPREVILEERRSMDNPQEVIGYSIGITPVPIPEPEKEAIAWADQGRDHLLNGRYGEALELYEKAYPRLKSHREAFRILGNMATAHSSLGHREEALRCLRASVQLNPDYSVARNNLHLLETMTPKQFKKLFKEGFFSRHERIDKPKE